MKKLKSLAHVAQRVFIFILIVSWLFAGWPNFKVGNFSFPEKTKTAEAAANQIILLWEASSTPTGWTCISCAASDPFFQVFPRASSTYANASSGAATISHTITFSTSTGPSVTTTTGQAAGSAVPNNTHIHTWADSSTDSVAILPSFYGLRFIEAATTTLPNGAIGMFDVSATSSLPSGWTYYSGLNGNYLRGGTASSTGGAATHTHAIAVTSGNAANGTADTGSGVTVGGASHSHTLSGNTAADNNAPSYVNVVFAQLGATSSVITGGLIAMFDTTSTPSGWTIISGAGSVYNGRLLKGNNSTGGQGGSDTHNHTGSSTITSAGPSGTTDVTNGTSTNASKNTHTHNVTYTINSASSLPPYRDVVLAQYRPDFTESAYRFFANTDSVGLEGVSSNPSSSTDVPNAIALNATTGVLYAAGYDGSPGNNEWRIEARNVADGSLVYATTTNPSSNDDQINAIAIDASNSVMYLAGYDGSQGSTNLEVRVEKRNLSDGSLVYATTTNPTSANDAMKDVKLDISGGVMYLAGYQNGTSTTQSTVRIEKRNLSDGSLVYATTTDVGSSNVSRINSIALDIAGGVMYDAGYASSSGNLAWYLEKRTLSTGALSYSTTTNPTSNADEIKSIDIDVGGGAMYLGGYDSASSTTNTELRIEKRNLSDGSLSYSTTTNPTTVDDRINAVIVDAAGGVMYTAGYQNAVFGASNGRLEKRNLSDGSLSYATTTNPGGQSVGLYTGASADIANGRIYTAGSDLISGDFAWHMQKRQLSDGSALWGTALAAQNTAATAPTQGTAFRLRMLTRVDGGTAATSTLGLKLQVATSNGSCDTGFVGETYADVATSSGAIRFYNNSTPADGDKLASSTIDPTNGSDPILVQTYEEANSASNSVKTILPTKDGEWDFSLVDNSANGGTAFCFRLTKSDGTLLDTYSQIPQVTTSGNLQQSGYRWFNNADSSDLNVVTENLSSGNDVGRAIAVDATNSVIYVVSNDHVPGNDEWRIEKRSVSDGSLVYATTSNPSSNSDIPTGIALDISNSVMYVVGYDGVQGASDSEWRIEKRNTSDGSLVYATTTNITGDNDVLSAIAIDSSFMYLAGQDNGLITGEWRIEKRNLSDGSLVYAKTTPSVDTYSSANAIALDSANMFVVGYNGNNGSNQWWIEKRRLSDGALQFSTTTGSNGGDAAHGVVVSTSSFYVVGDSGSAPIQWVIQKRRISDGFLQYEVDEDVSSGNDSANDITLDDASGVMYVAGRDVLPGNFEWRFEKRNLSDGSLVYAKTANPSSGNDDVSKVAIDVAGGQAYVVGYDAIPGNQEIRIEKRALSDGSLSWGGTPLAGLNTAFTLTNSDPFRLQMLVHASSGIASQSFKLQEAQRSGSCDAGFSGESYSDVATSSGNIRFYDNPTPSDGDSLTTSTSNYLTHGSDPITPGTYEEQSNFTLSNVTSSGDGLVDFALVATSTAFGASHCFRIVKSDGSLLDTYNVMPEVLAADFTQSSYRWYTNTDSPVPSAVLVNPSSGNDVGQAIAVDATNSVIYIASYDYTPGNNEWRIEKRNTSDGSLVYATTSNPSSNSDIPYAIALDASGATMYVVGIDSAQGASDPQWRIEKRNTSDGSLVYAITTNLTSDYDLPYAIAVDSSFMYIAGYQNGIFTAVWTIQKRNLSDGSLVYTKTTPYIDDYGWATAIAINSTDMFVVGHGGDAAPQTNWWIEKRRLSDGTLLFSTSTGTHGDDTPYGIALSSSNYYIVGNSGNYAPLQWVIQKRDISTGNLQYEIDEDVSAGNDSASDIAIDAVSGVMYVVGRDALPVNLEWRFEKRSLSNGSLIYATTTNPGSGNDDVSKVAIDVAGGQAYVVGYDITPGNQEIRIEKRSLSDGGLTWGSPLAAQDTSSMLTTKNAAFRLRMLIHHGFSAAANNDLFKLQYAVKSGDCDTSFSGESYTDVLSGGLSDIGYYNNSTPADDTTSTASAADPAHGSDTTVVENYEESNNFQNGTAIGANKDGEWDFSLKDNSAPAGTSYCFRAATAVGGPTPLLNNTVIPEIRTLPLPAAPGTPTYTNVVTSTLIINWTAASYADYYRLERGTSTFAEIATTTALAYNDSGLATSTAYMYRVRGTNTQGNGPWSASSSVTTKLFAAAGNLISVIIDTLVTNGAAPNSFYWEGNLPANTTVKLQFAAATSTAGPWTYYGWNSQTNACDANSYYQPANPGVPMEIKAQCFNNKRYLRYQVYIATTDPVATPQVDRVILNYAR